MDTYHTLHDSRVYSTTRGYYSGSKVLAQYSLHSETPLLLILLGKTGLQGCHISVLYFYCPDESHKPVPYPSPEISVKNQLL